MVVRAKLQIISQNAKHYQHKSYTQPHNLDKQCNTTFFLFSAMGHAKTKH